MMAITPCRRWIIWLLLGGPCSLLLSCQSSLHIAESISPPPDSTRPSSAIDGDTQEYPAATSLVAGSVLPTTAQPRAAAASYAMSDAPPLSTPTFVTAASTSPILSSSYEASTGERVRFFTSGAHWHAIAASQPSRTLPVVSQIALGPYLRWLQGQDRWTVKGRLHLMPLSTSPTQLCVYVGKAGLLGGTSDAQATAVSSHPNHPPPASTLTATTSTPPLQQLIEEFNAPNTPQAVKDDCRKDIEACIGWIRESSQAANLVAYEANMLACVALSEIRVSSVAHQQVARPLLQGYFDTLFTKLSDTDKAAEEQILAGVLSQALHRAEKSVLVKGRIKELLTCADDLSNKLNKQGISGALIRGTHFYYQNILGALYEIFGHLRSSSALSIGDTKDVLASINSLEKKAIANKGCRPLLYDLFLVKAGLLSLSENFNQRINWGEARHFLLGSLYLGQFMFKAVNILPDVEALENSYRHFEEFFKSITFSEKVKDLRQHYGQHMTLSYHALSSMAPIQSDAASATTNFDKFKRLLEQYTKKAKPVRLDSNAHYIFNFGITKHLEQLALTGTTEGIREESIDLLKRHIQRKPLSPSGYPVPEHEDVLHVILDALARLAAHGEAPDLAKNALAALAQGGDMPNNRQRNRFCRVFEQWLGGSSLAAKITSLQEALPVAPDEAGLLAAAGATHRAISRKLQTSLQAHYLSTYATLPSLFSEDNEEPKAMESLKASYKLSLVASEDEAPTSRSRLYLKDLFRGTPTSLEGQGALSRVLIVGLPGVGKTTLSKQLAYQWGQGALWQEAFTYVYVLPIRTLSETLTLRGPHKSWNVPLTLPHAIMQQFYEDLLTDDASYKTLHAQVVGHLSSEATLVVLDGLDERSKGRQQERLLREAAKGAHKLLLLSRPYGIEDMRASSTRKVEHDGLDLAQMRSYVKKYVPAEHTEELLSLLSEEAQVQEIACVPINLEILCYLFRHSSAKARAGLTTSLKQGSLPKLYSALTRDVWKRYIKDRRKALSPTSDHNLLINKESVFDVLGRLGYEALQREEGSGRTWISREQLDDLLASALNADTSEVPAMLQDTGFLLLRWLDSPGIYEFPHLTFQEYFAGRWLSKQLSSDDKRAKEKAEAFIKDPANRYDDRYGRMFTFMAGEAMKDEDNRYENLRNLLVLSEEDAPAFNASPVDIRHLAFQLRILNEWAIVSDEAAVEWGLADLSVTRAFDVRATVRGCVQAGIALIKELKPNRLFPVLRATLSSFRGIGLYVVSGYMRCLLKGVVDGLGMQEDLDSHVQSLGQYTTNVCLSEVVSITSVSPSGCLESLQRLYADDASSVMRRCVVHVLGRMVYITPTLKERVTTFLDESASRCTDEAVRAEIAETRRTTAALLTCNFITRRLPTADLAFGAEAWAKYFGEVGEPPALPDDLEQILDSRCPFFRDKDGGALLLRETHLLTLIPARVDGAPLTLNLLERLIQSPKNGGHATKYEYYDDDVQQQIGDTPLVGAYWALVTRDILPGSRYKDYAFQQALVAKYEGYALPGALEVATSILCHHVRSGERLLGDDPWTYSRCKDLVAYEGQDYPVVVGGFARSGLDIVSNLNDFNDLNGVVSFRKF